MTASNATHLNSLEEIISTAERLQEHLCCFLPTGYGPKEIEARPKEIETADEWAQKLHLPDVDSYAFLQALSRRSISTSVVDSASLLREKQYEEIRQHHLSHWRQLFFSCQSLNCETRQAIVHTAENFFKQAVKGVEEKIITILDAHLKKFCRDADASAQSETESSSEDALLVPRGHSKLAITILEKAYSRTTNITRAEKLRLATATKLEPRQVTIWVSGSGMVCMNARCGSPRVNGRVRARTKGRGGRTKGGMRAHCSSCALLPTSQFQNRRNRKTAATQAQAVEEGTSEGKSRKRKAEGLYGGEARRPSQRTRTSTPDSSPSSSRDVYLNGTSSASSLASSIDSLAQWSRGTLHKERNYSSDSSVLSNPALPSSFDENNEESVPHFNDSHLVPGFSFDSQVGENFSSSMLFSDAGVVQLDFDDLGLDLKSLVEELPSFGMDAFDFMPTPSALVSNQPTNIHFDLNETPRQNSFAVPDLPSTKFEVASTLAVSSVDATIEIQRAQQIEEWAFGMSDVLDGDCDDSWFLSLQGLSSADTTSPCSGTMSLDTTSNVATPTDASDVFDFSLQGLAIDHIMQENHASFGGKDPMGGHRTFRLDIEAANRNGSVSVVEPASV